MHSWLSFNVYLMAFRLKDIISVKTINFDLKNNHATCMAYLIKF